MKKLFTLVCAALLSVGLFAASAPDTVTVALSDLTQTGATYAKTWNSSQSIKKKVLLVELPSATAEGEITILGSDNANDRFLYIYGTNGTVKDETRAIVMSKTASAISFTASDIETKNAKFYLHFYTENDFKFKTISYTLADPTKATVKSISIDGEALTDFDAATLSYDVELAYGYEGLPVVAATTGNGATLNITQVTALPGAATVVCTSKDGTSETKTYTINFTLPAAPSTDATLKSLTVDGKAVVGFAADELEYNVELEFDVTENPVVAAEVNEAHANAVITQATAIPGSATVVVTAQDGETKLTYTINFTKETEIPIIRAIHVNKNTATMKGSIGGTSDKSTQDGSKFGSDGHYWGITLADSKTFQKGDSLVLDITVASENGTIKLYAEKTGETLLHDFEVAGVVGKNSFILPEALDGKATFYLVRVKDTNPWNAFLQSISVYRHEKEDPTALDNTDAAVKATKVVRNGQLLIEKNGEVYNVLGARIR